MTITANRRTVLKAGAAGLGLAGAAPVLAACSGDSVPGGGSGAAAEYEQGSAALEVELGPEIEGVNYPEDYVGPKHRELEPFGDGETETGVQVSYQGVPLGDDGQTTVNASRSGGDLPDAIMSGMGLFTPSQVAIYGEMGMFVPVDELIDRLAPHIREMFEQFPEMR